MTDIITHSDLDCEYQAYVKNMKAQGKDDGDILSAEKWRVHRQVDRILKRAHAAQN